MVYIEAHGQEPETNLSSYPLISKKARVLNSKLGRYTEIRPYVECIESSVANKVTRFCKL